MAIKNKNLMMSLTESLNENKKQEIANFKKLKEATEDNVSYVKYLLDTAEDMDDVQQAIYQIDDSALENEVQLMFDSCSEDDSLEEVISLVVSTMEDNAEYDEEMNESEIDDARKDSIEKGLISENEVSDESNEDDRKNTLIAKKDELESRLGDILQSIKDKQMDTEEFRKLSREAADLDSQIMDLDNQIQGVYECDKQINESDEDVCKGITDQLVSAGMTKEQAEQTAKGICNIFKNKVGSNQVVNEDISVNGDEVVTEQITDIIPLLNAVEDELNEEKYRIDIDEDIKDKDYYYNYLDKILSNIESARNTLNKYLETDDSVKENVNEDVSVNGDDNSLNSIVWDNIEDYDDSEKEEIRNILQNLDFEVAGVDGHSVSIKLKPNGMVFWIDYSNDGSDIVGDWNQYIFDTTNSEDRIRKAIQTSYYEDTGDTIALEPMESAGFEYLENKGIIKDTGKGYSFTDVNESAKPIKEAAVTEKNLLKSQGNVYMFECKGNSDFSHIVGENYNEEENTLENVETYNNKEDADKDYLGRCEITSESQNLRNITNESDDGSYDYEELWVQLPETFTAFVRNEIEGAVDGDLSEFISLTAQDILDSYNENYGEEIFDNEEELEDEEESYNYLGYIESRLNDAKQKAGVDKLDSDSYVVKSYHVENMGGGTMAIFGQLEDGKYFAGNEDGLNLYDIDVWPYYEKDTSDEEFQQLEKDHNIGSIDSIDNRFEYEKIISQTNF